jgi:hypothetical protein
MKTRFLVLTTAAALVTGAFAFAGTDSDKNSPATDLDRLQEKITALESRLKNLEQQRQTPAPLIYAPRVQPQIQTPPMEFTHPFSPPSAENSRRPKIWGEGEINGWKYYLIPCGTRDGASPEVAPVKVVSPK